MKSPLRLAILPGDGIGPEVTDAALLVLHAAAEQFGIRVETETHPIGYAAFQQAGHPLPPKTREAVLGADAVFLGAVGDPRSDEIPPHLRPEAGLLELRKILDCFANLRPARTYEALAEASPLRPERIRGMDFLIVRELAGGLYYGEPRSIDRKGPEAEAVNTLRYSTQEIRRVARVAFGAAQRRRGSLVSVDKANVLETSRLWREVVTEVGRDFQDVRLEHMLVDRAAMELVLRPGYFDVILTENLFGDILSDEAAALTGSIGLMSSASLGTGAGLYEPVHGSAPDIAGRGIANPLGAILSMALLLEHSAERTDAARAIEAAVESVLGAGMRTAELARKGERAVGTQEVAEAVRRALG
ncbi:MAG: 3-isopropylmalate dehydrogenase [Gemmatimonadetes bacterium]|nr:3-isopropylmalate dehydrogenase [Gemmatimonadota bacterium]